MGTLDELLAGAAAADGMRRIEFRDAIAEFGDEAIAAVEPWLSDPRLARFALLTIERIGAEPRFASSARASLQRGRATCAESARAQLDAALARLGRAGLTSFARVRPAAQFGFASVVPVPPVLEGLVEQWRASGSPPQPPIPWPRGLWLTDLPDQSDLLCDLPTLLERAAIRSFCADASTGTRSAERALVAVMVWGQGNRGYGRFRTSRILSAAHASERLCSVARTLAADGPLAAYRRLADPADCGIANLGAAFGTKYLYFCQPSGQETTALILDKNLADWLLVNAGLHVRSQPWSEPRYAAYLRQMHAWAAELACAPDEVELCIFQAMANESGGQWSTGRADGEAKAVKSRVGRPWARREMPTNNVPSATELQFDQAMLDIYSLAGRETGYWAGYFLRSVRQDGGLQAARKLLWKSGTSEGFERLKAEGRLDLSMEALMLRPEFRELFSAEELAQASDRLAAHGYSGSGLPPDRTEGQHG